MIGFAPRTVIPLGFALALLVPAAPLTGVAQDAPPTTTVPDPASFEAAAPTDDPELEAQVRKLASELRCPTCQALSIADSPSELAREMEGVIRDRLQSGMSPEEVRRSFVDSYGEWVLLSPNPAGFNLFVYLLPLAVLLVGGAVIVVGVRRWTQAPAHPFAVAAGESDGTAGDGDGTATEDQGAGGGDDPGR